MRLLPTAFSALVIAGAICVGHQEPPIIRTDVNLVQLHVRVTDAADHAVAGLGKSSFQLFVDEAPTDITVFQGEDAPVTAGIVVDNSASMAAKRQEVIAGALAFARASNPKDQMFVVHFNSTFRFGLPQGTPFTGSIAELEQAIAGFNLGGTTAFYDALLAAESHFKVAAYPNKVLLTITDGGDNSSRATLAEAIAGARDASILIYPIGVFDENDRDRNPTVLTEIADQTGGIAFFPERVSAVTETCVNIARDIREQYTLGFPGATDGQYHRIRLVAHDPRRGLLKAHTRAGYMANRPSGSP
jgi:VWFA-related protein